MPEPYTLALSKARAELEAANQEVKAISLRISGLEAVIAQLQALIASAKPIPMSLSFYEDRDEPAKDNIARIVGPDRSGPPAPLWKAIINALNGKKADFTVPDACAALDRTGRFINSPNKKSIVRTAIKQKPDMFERIREGHYRVIGFEALKEES